MNSKKDTVRILMPFFRVGTGCEVYFENIAKAVSEDAVILDSYSFLSGKLPYIVKNRRCSSDYDLVHTIADGGFCFKQEGKPFISSIFIDVWDEYYQGHATLAQKLYYNLLLRHYTQKTISLSDVVVTESEFTSEAIEKRFGRDVRVIRNGVDIDLFKPEKKDWGEDVVELLFAGSLTRRKGADLLPKIMDNLGDRFKLTCASSKYGVDVSHENIIVRKFKRDEMPKAYNSCDIFLFPSRLEGMSNAVLEAMSCGKPVITADSSSIPEMIDDGRGGFLCKPDDTRDFADKIRYLAENPAESIKMGAYNRGRAVGEFNLAILGEEFINLYEEVLM